MRKCFKTGGGFGVWVDDEETPEAPAPAITEAPAAPVATDEDDEVPPEHRRKVKRRADGDCDGCAKKPSVQPPKAT